MAMHCDEYEDHNCFCVPSRCRLCRFPLDIDDRVVAIYDDRRSLPYAYSYDEKYDRQMEGVVYGRSEYEEIPASHLVAAGCHADCFAFAGGDGGVDQRLLDTTFYAFPPPHFEEKRRFRRTELFLQRQLYKTVPLMPRLPPEIRAVVTGCLVRECAITHLKALLETHSTRSEDNPVDLFMDVWARYIFIDGVRYVARLSNSRENERDMQLSTYSPSKRLAGKSRTMYTVGDHFGIRQVIFSQSENRVPTNLPTYKDVDVSHGNILLWWRTITAEKITITTDVSVKFVIYAHRAGDDSTAMYRHIDETFPPSEESSSGTWVHFPVGPGEHIVNVFRRNCDVFPVRAGIMLQTSRDRVMTIGRCIPPRERPGWTRLFGLVNEQLIDEPPSDNLSASRTGTFIYYSM